MILIMRSILLITSYGRTYVHVVRIACKLHRADSERFLRAIRFVCLFPLANNFKINTLDSFFAIYARLITLPIGVWNGDRNFWNRTRVKIEILQSVPMNRDSDGNSMKERERERDSNDQSVPIELRVSLTYAIHFNYFLRNSSNWDGTSY